MKNLLLGAFIGFLAASVWNNYASAAQTQKEATRIWVGTELHLGMPKDTVIANVAEAGYQIRRAPAIEGASTRGQPHPCSTREGERIARFVEMSNFAARRSSKVWTRRGL
jgi:hypothetical protein